MFKLLAALLVSTQAFAASPTIFQNVNIKGAMVISSAKGNLVASANAVLDLRSDNKGFFPPRMTTSAMASITVSSASAGLIIFNTTANAPYFYTGSEWSAVGTGSGGGGSGSTPVISVGNDQTPTNSLVAGVESVAVFGTVSPNTNSAYDTSTGVYTVPFTGNYLVTATVSIGGTAVTPNNVGAGITLKQNGSVIAGSSVPTFTSGIGYTATIAFVTPAVGGDTLQVFARSDLVAPSFSAFVNNSNLMITKLDGGSGNTPSNVVLNSGASTMNVVAFRFAGDAAETSVCSSDPCTISYQTGGVSAVNNGGASNYYIHFDAGVFSANPTCTYTGMDIVQPTWVTRQAGIGNTALVQSISSWDSTGAQTQDGVSGICIGPK